ncbi:G-protein coupled receptor 4-like [Cheilinus undulatus]|uniref:G-protein coupled receptor 4-like n=1 Tax=Cheilinus undulatus TaxID=241271 RepID=UPI001BD50E66|nr:G-protein coupled receptor 4-like [Cheilinus undulatus]XP_041644912.1 G-protein coupled receptor 4-like [Cheilinus undulatus]XP_041644913.1 G-protein coupled receptor 4-like [Cheilinus undulatus]XP_041644914.1 G-protein coupled receptor 4-like [Cheilinus undulatus]XP_041644915.1 G-protein coupled receptor 4-like [Cheilinus undulatus]
MENLFVNTTLLNESFIFDSDSFLSWYEYHIKVKFTMHVVTCIIIGIGLPLMLMAIYALCSLVKNDHVAPIYIINLFISDFIQLCCMIIWESEPEEHMIKIIVDSIYKFGLLTSVGFMVCISLERYLIIAHPLWYHFRRSIRISVAVCVVVWIISLVFNLAVLPWVTLFVEQIILSFFLITPLPLFIFFLVGTLRALSTSVSVPSNEKRRIVAILVLVLLIYTLLFLPCIILFTTAAYIHDDTLYDLSFMFLKLSPLADLLLYFFIRMETVSKLWTSVCCCRKENNDTNFNTLNLADI